MTLMPSAMVAVMAGRPALVAGISGAILGAVAGADRAVAVGGPVAAESKVRFSVAGGECSGFRVVDAQSMIS